MTIAEIEVGQLFKLQRDPQGAEYCKIDKTNAREVATLETRTFGRKTLVILPPYSQEPEPKRQIKTTWIDGANFTFSVSPFMARQLDDLGKEYGGLAETLRAALGAWRVKLRPVMPLMPEKSDMQALCAFTGLRQQEVLELAVYDLWKGYKGL